MEYSPEYRKSAEKYLDSQDLRTRLRIIEAIDGLPQGDVRKLKGRDGYRLVVGNFRVIFNYTDEVADDGSCVLDIITIGARGDTYKK